MATVKFTIKGLAVCYRQDNDEFWKIVFPTDNLHVINFWTSRDTELNKIPLRDKRSITITANSIAPDEYQDAKFTKYVIDLTADYLHSHGLTRKIQPSPPTGERKLTIPHAKLTSVEEREGRLNYVFPFDDPGEIHLIRDKDNPEIPQIFSKLVGGEINLSEGGRVTIEIDGEETKHLSAGESFHFDNDCDSLSARNDFQLYQDLFSNKVYSEKRFELVSINDPNLNKEFTLKLLTNPPPLVCDTSRISNPDGLT